VRVARGRRNKVTLCRLYGDEGRSIAALAAYLDVAPQSVHNWLVAAGVPRRQPAASSARRH
jgi:transposase-like protein